MKLQWKHAPKEKPIYGRRILAGKIGGEFMILNPTGGLSSSRARYRWVALDEVIAALDAEEPTK